eukprot:TRINITY_DN14118_c0_g1_i2.p4 TRINITY_DN14118_c0_g1~~TRINITY_DN14118_c0_g1_i2.p4  ORF type:complete len:122 (-),score=25.88 TRINITY_DN14118_c0_g1_i2:18-383(-)
MALRCQAELPADSIADLGKLGHVDRNDLAGVEPHERVAGALAVGKLVLGLVALGEHALEDAGLLQEVDGAIDGGLAHAVPALAELVGKRMRRKDEKGKRKRNKKEEERDNQSKRKKGRREK